MQITSHTSTTQPVGATSLDARRPAGLSLEEMEIVAPPDPAQAGALAGYLTRLSASVQELRQVQVDSSVRPAGELEYPLPTGTHVKTTEKRLGQALQLAEKRTFVVGADGKLTKAAPQQWQKVALRLAAFSESSLDELDSAGVRVLLVDPRRVPQGGYPGGKKTVNEDGTWPANLGGYYNDYYNDIVMPEEYLDKPFDGNKDTLLHELGHALSDARVSDTETKIKSKAEDPVLRGLLGAYRKRCGYNEKEKSVSNPDAIWSGYALKSEHEYLAEGVRVVLSRDASQVDKLRQLDPEMFRYVTTFLQAEHEGTGFWDWVHRDENPRGRG